MEDDSQTLFGNGTEYGTNGTSKALTNKSSDGLDDLDTKPTRSQRYVACIDRFRWPILVLWLIVLGLAAWQASYFFTQTDLLLTPPKGSNSDIADNYLYEYFHNASIVFGVLMRRNDGSSIVGNDTATFSAALQEAVLNYQPSIVTGVISYFAIVDISPILGPVAADFLFGRNGSETIVVITCTNTNKQHAQIDSEKRAFVRFLDHTVATLAEKHLSNNTYVQPTGEAYLELDLQSSAERDMSISDGAALPVSLLILSYVVGSFRFVAIPLFIMAFGVFVALGILHYVALITAIIPYTAPIVTSVCIAASLDYCMFILSRLTEELRKTPDVKQALPKTMASAGFTVLVSSLALSLSFFSLGVYSNQYIAAPGYGSGIAIVVVLLACFTFLPATILAFPQLITGGIVKSVKQANGDEEDNKRLGINNEATPLLDADATEADDKNSRWYRFAAWLDVPWKSFCMVLILMALAMPCCVRIVSFEKSTALLNGVPRDASASEAFKTAQDDLNTGLFYPFYIVMIPPAGVEPLSQKFYKAGQSAIDNHLRKIPLAENVNYLSAFAIDRIHLNYDTEVAPCLKECKGACEAICALVDNFVNPEKGQYMLAITPFDPFSLTGQKWLPSARQALKDWESETGFKAYVGLGSATEIDGMDQVYNELPLVLGVACILIFTVVGVAFRSITIAIRCIVTIALSVMVVLACAIWVYQCGALDWMGFYALEKQDALSWMTPILCVPVMIGMGLDYDIFLVSRVLEYRRAGLSDSESIRRGLRRTGGLINAAGIIMTIAFIGLLFSQLPILNEMSFMLVLFLLLDTFVVRAVIVPSVLFLLGPINWFPAALRGSKGASA